MERARRAPFLCGFELKLCYAQWLLPDERRIPKLPVFLIKGRSPATNQLGLQLLARAGGLWGFPPKSCVDGCRYLVLKVSRLIVQHILLAVVDTLPTLIGFAGFAHIEQQRLAGIDHKINAGSAGMAIGGPLEEKEVLQL